MARPVRIEPVETRADLRRFIDLPWSVYEGDANWVPPLKRDVRAAFDPSKHPFHRHSEVQPYIALRDGEAVGRICAIDNRNHEAVWKDGAGFFGWFECIDDAEVAEALLETAAAWLRERGRRSMRGPASFSINDTCGVLVEGDPGLPTIMMAHNPPYYPALLEGAGLTKAKDLYAHHLDLYAYRRAMEQDPEHLYRLADRIARKRRVRLRQIRMSSFKEELRLVRRLYNAVWEKNWGFVPMTDAEIAHLAAELKPIVRPELVLFAESEAGETIGFVLAVPEFNPILQKMNGRLSPLGLARALIQKRRIKAMRVLVLGVLGEWRGKGIDAVLYVGLIRNGLARGFNEAEQSWVLEDNHKMNTAVKRLGGRVYRKYRIYETAL